MDAGNQIGSDLAVVETTYLSVAQREAVTTVINRAREKCGLCFGVYVGPLPDGRDSAIAQHALLPDPLAGVLVAVDPQSHGIDIVTGTDAARVLDNRACELAVLAMASCFAIDDLVAGIREGVQLLAEHARTPRVWHMDDPD